MMFREEKIPGMLNKNLDNVVNYQNIVTPGADPGEVKWVNFHPPFSEPP